MPHFGLMNESALGPSEGPLQRARLHIRGGRRRLRQGKISAGLVTLYDALEGAMNSYLADPRKGFRVTFVDGEDRNNTVVLYNAFVRSGVLDGALDFPAFDRLVEKALNQEMSDYDYHHVLKEIESVMTQLGVMPFEESSLPPEDPATF